MQTSSEKLNASLVKTINQLEAESLIIRNGHALFNGKHIQLTKQVWHCVIFQEIGKMNMISFPKRNYC